MDSTLQAPPAATGTDTPVHVPDDLDPGGGDHLKAPEHRWPVMHFEILRRIAETASGLRYSDTYYEVVHDKDGNASINVYIDEPPPHPNRNVIKCHRWPRPRGPRVKHARIMSDMKDAKWVDLMDLEVPAEELQGWEAMGPDGKKKIHADAVFWSAAAVEKFLIPYYASTYGSMAPRVVEQLLNVFVPPDSPEIRGNGVMGVVPYEDDNQEATELGTVGQIQITEPEDLPFALIHLPSSEYAFPEDPEAALPFATVHHSGKVKRLRVGKP
ncbi:MAG TPA: hypothetical protein VFJ82_23350 [Longimicrobium sp.]|nr:hypothetical protein [Longimicrobium sp.]